MDVYDFIKKVEAAGIELTEGEFTFVGDELLLDGMPADEWLEAMTME